MAGVKVAIGGDQCLFVQHPRPCHHAHGPCAVGGNAVCTLQQQIALPAALCHSVQWVALPLFSLFHNGFVSGLGGKLGAREVGECFAEDGYALSDDGRLALSVALQRQQSLQLSVLAAVIACNVVIAFVLHAVYPQIVFQIGCLAALLVDVSLQGIAVLFVASIVVEHIFVERQLAAQVKGCGCAVAAIDGVGNGSGKTAVTGGKQRPTVYPHRGGVDGIGIGGSPCVKVAVGSRGVAVVDVADEWHRQRAYRQLCAALLLYHRHAAVLVFGGGQAQPPCRCRCKCCRRHDATYISYGFLHLYVLLSIERRNYK